MTLGRADWKTQHDHILMKSRIYTVKSPKKKKKIATLTNDGAIFNVVTVYSNKHVEYDNFIEDCDLLLRRDGAQEGSF